MIEIAPKETEIRANWYDATLYCFSLNIDGKTGWRLPSKDELNEIYKSKNDFEPWFYWSSTEEDEIYVWNQGFGRNGGSQSYNRKGGSGDFYTRAIRTIP
jgi:hypothetical protein